MSPTVYYQDKAMTVWAGRCEDVHPLLSDACADLILCDPPYFRVKNEWWDRQWESADGFLAWLSERCVEWRRLLKPNGSLYVFASPEMAARVECLIAEHFNVLNCIRWVKEDGWHQKTDKEALRAFLSPWEAIIFAEQVYSDRDADDLSGYGEACRTLHQKVYSPIGRRIAGIREGAGLTRNQVEVALGYVSGSDPTRGTALCYRWEEGACLPSERDYCRLLRLCGDQREYDDLRREYDDLRRPFNLTERSRWHDVWDFRTVPPSPGKHPCQKPTALLEHIIRTSTTPGAMVLDSCAGSGSTLRAAANLGRRAIGIEVEPAWCRMIVQRLAQQVLPLEDIAMAQEVAG